jgi:hypothetical protein
MLIQKSIIFDKINELRDALIEKVKYVYDRQDHSSTSSSNSTGSSGSSGSSGTTTSTVTVKGIKEKVRDNLEFKDNYALKITEYFTNFCNFLNSYLDRSNSNDLSEAVKEVLVWAYGYEYRRRLVYEKPMNFGIPVHPSYSNLENLFWDLNKIININVNDFIQASEFTYTVTTTSSSGSSGSGSSGSSRKSSPMEFSKNPIFENFKTEINTLKGNEVPALTDLSEWLKHKSGGNFYLMNKFEDMGKIVHFPDTNEMIQCIFYDTNLIKIIKYFNIKTYIPTSLKNVTIDEIL